MSRHLHPAKHFLIASAILLPLIYSGPQLLFAQSSSPSRLLICESIRDACNGPDARLDTTWIFDGAEGTVNSSASQAQGHLTIERLDSESMVVRRVDQAGATAGLTALYSGSIRGKHLTGTVQWSWPGHPDQPTKGFFAGVFEDQLAAEASAPGKSAASLPSELLVCENGGVCNAAWSFQGSSGTGIWFTRKPTRATLAIVRSEPDYIMIRRTDTTDGVSATYAGSLRGDHYAGTIVWSTPGHPGEATGSWTASVPQTACATQSGLEAADAMRIGQYALMFKRDQDALDCYIVAAKAGDATAQAAVGLLYYQGHGAVAQDYTQAFFWLHKAADQGVFAAQRTVEEMYTAGQGTQANPTLAAIYTARADEQKHDMERRQDAEERAQARREESAERAADRVNNLLSSFVLGASFGLFF